MDTAGRLLARERLVLTGERHRQRALAEGHHDALATIFVLTGKDDPEPILGALRGALAELPEAYAGASLLPNDCGLWARILTPDGASLRTAMHAAWAAAREAITGVPPRARRN